MRMAWRRGVGVLSVLLVLGGHAARADCLEQAFTGASTGASPRAAAVGGTGPRANFVRDGRDRPGCPDDSEACRKSAFVVPGDVVLVAGQQGAYACAAFTNGKGVTSLGMLPAAVLAPIQEGPGSAAGWIGTWLRVESTIAIKPAATPGELAVRGDATWGGSDPARVRSGGVNLGEVEGSAAPDGSGVLAFTQGNGRTLPYDPSDATTCSIWMLRRGPYLVVADNLGCGGMNVSFSGIYRRR